MGFKHEKLEHSLAQIKNLYASLDGTSSILLLVSAGLFFLGLCLKVAVFMKRCTVTVFHHDKGLPIDCFAIGCIPRKVSDGRKPVRNFSDKQ
ncbi:hypothetical protein ASPTUDRAFT_44292 [Aspergillus tubingensis CBS 134.48]|uniref:Uncharacterized protein n=1 Tax=Aspergillus tubingensis (strain CBS 134.48) TaxID=767770 RepID=A0A1L9N111_ASPTC|nr:hypothetical protein ASPTUDRAFT_44292 [Aspergillus tubingensis CBS 134.48]